MRRRSVQPTHANCRRENLEVAGARGVRLVDISIAQRKPQVLETSRSRGNQSALPSRHFTRTRKMEAGPTTSVKKRASQENWHESDSEEREGKKKKIYEWTVTEVGDTWIKMKHTKEASFSSKNLAALSQLLKDPVIKKFLATDMKCYSTNKHLLTMMIKYFDCLGLHEESYKKSDFSLSLYTAGRMNSTNLSYRQSMIPVLLGENWSQRGLRKFWPMPMGNQFCNKMDKEAWMKQDVCQEDLIAQKVSTPKKPKDFHLPSQ
ncbi:speedy protein E4-like [Monodelphis domestica]|uniref:speedy protein E4-like n=1 Tax=Monodelphis domestica TaxID=13616 RepID=UPI0024E23D83|nr:speedy protein E4-like [Monodelphis domestica]